MSTETSSTKVITGLVRFSFMSVWEPKASEDNPELKYSTAIIIPKSDKATIKAIKAAEEVAKELGKSKWGGKIPAKLKTPLRDGDEEKPDDPAYENCYFLNANSKNAPGILDRYKQVIPKEKSDEVYSGCYGRVSLNFYPYDMKGNKGVGAGLNNLMKVKDGEPLAGKASAIADFADVEDIAEDDDDLM